MEFEQIEKQLNKVFTDIEEYYYEVGMANDEDSIVQNAIDEALDFIGERYGVVFYKNGFSWDYKKQE